MWNLWLDKSISERVFCEKYGIMVVISSFFWKQLFISNFFIFDNFNDSINEANLLLDKGRFFNEKEFNFFK